MSLLQSDYFIQLVALSSVILMGILTYVLGYKAKSSDVDDEILQVDAKETKKQKVERAKKAESKDKKKNKSTVAQPKEAPVVAQPPSPKQEVKEVKASATKQSEPKPATPKPTPKSSKKSKQPVPEPVKPVVVEKVVEEVEEGWTTVTDKKQKNKSGVVQKQAEVNEKKVEKKVEKKSEKKTEKIVAEPVKVVEEVADDSWTTVTDKKQKKSQGSQERSSSDNTSNSPAATKSKKTKAKKDTVTTEQPVKVPEQAVTEIKTESPKSSSKSSKKSKENKTIEEKKIESKPVTATEPAAEAADDSSEWITANTKALKKSKAKAQQLEIVKATEVKQSEPVKEKTDSPKPGKKLKTKSKEQDSVKTPASDSNIPPAIQELINAQLTAPNSIAASIIEQFKNDNNNDNNNNIVSEKPKPDTAKKSESKSGKTKSANSDILKTTNLTESMILIDNDSTTGKSSTRTDSNPSSSESLQDLDVGEGWATITSKKKRTVRREV